MFWRHLTTTPLAPLLLCATVLVIGAAGRAHAEDLPEPFEITIKAERAALPEPFEIGIKAERGSLTGDELRITLVYAGPPVAEEGPKKADEERGDSISGKVRKEVAKPLESVGSAGGSDEAVDGEGRSSVELSIQPEVDLDADRPRIRLSVSRSGAIQFAPATDGATKAKLIEDLKATMDKLAQVSWELGEAEMANLKSDPESFAKALPQDAINGALWQCTRPEVAIRFHEPGG